MTKWTKEIPVPPCISGWVWVKYKDKQGITNVCPCHIINTQTDIYIKTARGDWFTKNTQDRLGFSDALFGPRIVEP